MATTVRKRVTKKDTFSVSFYGNALLKIKELALSLNIPDDNLTEVLVKGIKIIDLARDGKLIIEKGNERLVIDIKRI